jgi:molybdopterin biosynthesis enzyme
MRRVGRRGGLIVIGVPGYGVAASHALRRFARPLASAPGGLGRWVAGWLASTTTLLPHHHPGDYYRFSSQAVADVLLAGLTDVQTVTIMQPPRVIGSGRIA